METTSTNSFSSPWSGQQPYLNFGFDQAKQNYLNNTPQYAPFETWTDFSPQTLQGLDQTQNIAGQNLIGNAAANESFNTLDGQYLDNNPYLSQITDRVSADATNAVNSAFNSSGRYGSNSHADTIASNVADASAGINYQNYGDERQNMMRASMIAPQSDQLQYSGANQLMGVGGALEGKQNEALQDDINRWNFDQSQPDQQLAQYIASIGGNYGQQSQTSVVQPTYGGSTAQGILGGGALGYGIADSFPKSGISPWLGALGGGLLGGLFG